MIQEPDKKLTSNSPICIIYWHEELLAEVNSKRLLGIGTVPNTGFLDKSYIRLPLKSYTGFPLKSFTRFP